MSEGKGHAPRWPPASISTGDADSERLALKCSFNAVGVGVRGRPGRPEA